jgi:spore coat protein U-like protein
MPTLKLLAALAAATVIWPAAAGAAGSHTITVAATVLSADKCSFIGGASTPINLAIDPSSAAPVVGTASVQFHCVGNAPVAAYVMSADNGLYGASPSAMRMQNTANPASYLPYTLAFPSGGTVPKNTTATLTVTATVMPADFQDALPGSYSDTVTLTVTP